MTSFIRGGVSRLLSHKSGLALGVAEYLGAGSVLLGRQLRTSGRLQRGYRRAARLGACGATEGRPQLRTLLGLDVDHHTGAWHLANPLPDNM